MKACIALAFLAIPALLGATPQSAVVIVPVADVWNRPLAAGENPVDDLRETQVLYGEKVLIHESSGPWVRIEAVEQPTFRQHNRWEGYPGWTRKDDLGMIPYKPQRKGLVPMAWVEEIFLGEPYMWGGLTPGKRPAVTPAEAGVQKNGLGSGFRRNDGIKYGIDCSGLVHLVYRMSSKVIPRDAHEQWMKARPIKRAGLKPADLIFSAKANDPKKITHVALYAGNGQIIEAPQTGMAVRKISFKEKYGKPLEEVESGDRVSERVLYFGSFLHDGSPTTTSGMTLQ